MEKHIRDPCCYELYLSSAAVCRSVPPHFYPSACSRVCLARCATVVWQPGSFLSFPFDASRHISLEQASASWEQNSCLVSALLRLALPTFTHYPFSSFCSPLCPSSAFRLYCWKDREIVHSDVHTRTHTHILSHICRRTALTSAAFPVTRHTTTISSHSHVARPKKELYTCMHTHTHTHKHKHPHNLTVIFWPFIPSW